jgi:hypothetical protein
MHEGAETSSPKLPKQAFWVCVVTQLGDYTQLGHHVFGAVSVAPGAWPARWIQYTRRDAGATIG